VYALTLPAQRPRARLRGIGAPAASTSVQTPLDRELRRLREQRNWDVASLLISGGVGVVSLGLFASGRYAAGYTLAAASAIVGAGVTLLRITSTYQRQVEDLRASAEEGSA
jgi:hypothetical protein